MAINTIIWIILLSLIMGSVINFIADNLNLKALNPVMPKEFEDVYDTEAYSKSQEYSKVKTKFGWIEDTVSLIGFIAFWFLGGFEWINNWAMSWNFSFIPTALIFLGSLSILSGVMSTPFGLYNTFVIEERFGFNNTTWKTYIMDALKGLGLTVVFGIPLISAVLWVLEVLGPLAWFYAWLGMQVFTVIIQFIAPKWIMPIFNKFIPLEDGSLRSAILEFAANVKFDLQNIFVIDGSKRSAKSNAFFTGFGKNKRIALFDTLIEKHTEPELVAVLAHEIGHYKHKHIIKSNILNVVTSFITFWLLGVFMREQALYEAFFMSTTPIYAGIIFFSMVLSPLQMILSYFLNKLSRKHEFEADAFSANHTNDPEAMISALKKLSRDNLSNLTPHPFYVKLHYSHPPVLERIQAIQSLEK